MAPARHTRTTKPRRGGFTVAESLLASVVLAIAVVAVAGAIISAQSQTAIQESNGIAVSLARELMEEICSRPFTLPDPTPGWSSVTDRSQYDTINDYNGYSDTVSQHVARTTSDSVGTFTTALPPATVVSSGNLPTPSGMLFTRKVSVTYPATVFSSSDAANDFAIVTVTVRGANGIKVTLSRLIGSASVTR